MRYIKVIWQHIFEDEPYAFYSEIDANAYETRKIEFLKDGTLLGFASGDLTWGDAILSDQMIPSVSEINEDAAFDAIEITALDFENIWNKIYQYRFYPDMKTAEKRYPIILHLLKDYEQFVDEFGDEDKVAYHLLAEKLDRLTNKKMDEYHLYEAWEGEGIEVLSFRIALPDSMLINDLSKTDLQNILHKCTDLKMCEKPWSEQTFEEQFEIYLDDFYHKLLKINFKNYNYQKLFGKQKDGTWLNNEEIVVKLLNH